MYPNQYCHPCTEPTPCVPAPPPPDCIGEPCEEIVLDTCVRYTGPAIPCLGITTGADLSQVLQIIAARLCDCCDGTPPVVNCVVSAWSEWSECVDGVQTRTRTVIQAPQNGGTACPPLIETRSCCEPVDCVVSAWSDWSICDGDVRTRTRTVVTPASCGGATCPVLIETESCNLPLPCQAITNILGRSLDCETIEVSFSDGATGPATSLVAELVSTSAPSVVLQSFTFTTTGAAASYSHTFTAVAPGSYLIKVYKTSAAGTCDVVTTSAVTVEVCATCVPLTDIDVLSDNCETLQISLTDDGNATVLYAELFNNNAPTIVVSTKTWTPLGSATVYSHTFTGLTPGNYFVKIYKDAGTVKCDTIVTSAVLVPGCPVDCVVSDWSAWSECIEGEQTRTRTIVTPASNGGTPCPVLTETQPCDIPCVPLTNFTAISDNCETLTVSAVDNGEATDLHVTLYNASNPTVPLFTHNWTPTGNPGSYTHTFTGLSGGTYFATIYKLTGRSVCDSISSANIVVETCKSACPAPTGVSATVTA